MKFWEIFSKWLGIRDLRHKKLKILFFFSKKVTIYDATHDVTWL